MKHITIDWLHLCERFDLTTDGRVCLVGILEEVLFATFPVRLPPFTLVMRFNGPVGAVFGYTVRFERAGDSRRDASAQTCVDPLGRVHTFVKFTDIVVDRPGRYDVTVSVGGEVLASRPLFIVQTDREGPLPLTITEGR